ncbi:TIGR02757 family protein [Bernardetia sp.]|uniref:TIGR02757 family protein n=1 Tax=Bernardetia sp. TaxID=1937974 RepID=UPI0025C11DA5|nr:TIGR02757 family protein [Bernardetia sp.]
MNLNTKNFQKIKEFLDEKHEKYNHTDFIENDPIQIPHRFSKKQDIEISALFAATLAWGLRKTIINKCNLIMELMDESPHDFILNHKPTDLKDKGFQEFKHRTFNSTDLLYFIDFLQRFYTENDSLEILFSSKSTQKENLAHFHNSFFAIDYALQRTKKHVSTPERKSACKRLNMYLRWLVRKDDKGVDFGIWENISPSVLICPLDIHVERQAKKLGLLERKQTDWKAAEELTQNLRLFDPKDPVKYDFALFGLGVESK